ncbi:MAG: thrombospondin type 3 repeat-containing protein [Chlorobi bacterium]|nr:thrombospondin type 3 repeat-containing protein [Chlorobiota bacterium]
MKKRVLVAPTVRWIERSTTFYTYDAKGRVVAIYEKECDGNEPGEKDSDFDGVPDGIDNCGTVLVPVFNPDQRDTGKDGQGDACDPDIDDDGINNDHDPCSMGQRRRLRVRLPPDRIANLRSGSCRCSSSRYLDIRSAEQGADLHS